MWTLLRKGGKAGVKEAGVKEGRAGVKEGRAGVEQGRAGVEQGRAGLYPVVIAPFVRGGWGAPAATPVPAVTRRILQRGWTRWRPPHLRRWTGRVPMRETDDKRTLLRMAVRDLRIRRSDLRLRRSNLGFYARAMPP